MGNLSPKTGNLAASGALLGITFICAGLHAGGGGGGGGGSLSSLPGKKKGKRRGKSERPATANGDPGSFYSAATSTLVGGTEKGLAGRDPVRDAFSPIPPF